MGNKKSKSKEESKIDPISSQNYKFIDRFERQIDLKRKSIDDYHLKQAMTVFGWTRNNTLTINDQYNFNDIISIIKFYYQQGFAKYFDEALDENYKHEMKFGDIVRTKDSKFMAMDIDNELKHVGQEDQMLGFGAMLSFRLAKDIKPIEFLNDLELIKDVLSLGGVETTILSPAETSHSLLSEDERRAQGIDEYLLRLSCGIEEVEDLINDFENCIQKVR